MATRLTNDGITDTISGWARRLGISRQAMCKRLERHDVATALTTPPGGLSIERITRRQQAAYEQALRAELAASFGNVRKTAQNLGVSTTWVRTWSKKLGIDVKKFRPKPRRKKPTSRTGNAARRQAILSALHTHNLSMQEAAAALGTTLRRLSKECDELGLWGRIARERRRQSKRHTSHVVHTNRTCL